MGQTMFCKSEDVEGIRIAEFHHLPVKMVVNTE